MHSRSREVTSSQQGLHPRLSSNVLKHRDNAWLKPARAVDHDALGTLERVLSNSDRPLVLDSFCGTGISTGILAELHPEALVVGVDKSLHRLDRAAKLPDNALLLRANCESVWRFLSERGRILQAHYLLYPNPWPKPGHFSRRVHGHPAFACLVKLGGYLELRSNWQVYVEEFGVALSLYGYAACVAAIEGSDPEKIMDSTSSVSGQVSTRFEQKYRASGHTLWQLSATL